MMTDAIAITKLTPVLLIIFTGMIFLQIFLSKKSERWPGLVLPILLFLLSLVGILLDSEDIPTMIVGLIALNIPTIVLLLIYLFCRRRERRDKLLDKMNIQDLH